VNFYQTTRRYFPEVGILHNYISEKLKCYVLTEILPGDILDMRPILAADRTSYSTSLFISVALNTEGNFSGLE
jgi:hypothetical protein